MLHMIYFYRKKVYLKIMPIGYLNRYIGLIRRCLMSDKIQVILLKINQPKSAECELLKDTHVYFESYVWF